MNAYFKEIVEKYLECCNNHDADKMKDFLSADFVFKTYSVNGNGNLEHVRTLEEYILGEKESYKTWLKWSVVPQRWIIGNDSVVLTVQQTATYKKTGKIRKGEDVMIFIFKKDKINQIYQYYEVTSVLNAMANEKLDSKKK